MDIVHVTMKISLFLMYFLSFLSIIGLIFSFDEVYAQQQQQQDNTTGSEEVEFLSIQHAKSGLIYENNTTSYLLKLKNVSNETVLFSDRPDRIVESISTSDFIGNWTVGPNSFTADPPNAVLVYEDMQTGNLDTVTIELFNPNYDTNTNTLTYMIVTENGTSINLPVEFGQSIMVIDADGIKIQDFPF
ncbi:hypothetical protein YTPLAS21_09970 [Candidatus Nitrosocosmicus sp.]|nr:hypothetical protein YTPLAS21_09970 [Candidatus Nitrosocosmicus sp.]